MNDKVSKITQKVAKLFLEFGIRGVTMDDVAHQLSISKKTLYEHFNDKKGLVYAVLENIRNEWDKHFKSHDFENANAIDEIFYYYEIQTKMIRNNRPAFIYDLKKYYPDIHLKFQKIKQKMITESVMKNLKKGKEEGLYREDINNEVIAKLVLMRMMGIMNHDYFSLEDLVNKDLSTEIFKYHLFGIVSQKGRKIAEQKFNNTDN